MIIKEKAKIPNADETDYDIVYPENSADMVKFSDTTLANALENFEVSKIAHADYANEAEIAENDSAGNKIVDYYLPIDNAAMTGTPTAPTYTGTDTTVNQLCTCDYFNSLVREVAGNVDSDMTLAKLITSINKDPNFATTTAIKLGEKQNASPLLNSLAEGNFAANSILYSTDSGTFLATPVTAFGGEILQTQSSAKLLRLLKARTPDFYDEADQLKWKKTGSPSISSSGLSVTASNYLQSSGLVIGGNPFTIEFSFKNLAHSTSDVPFSLGNFSVGFSWGSYFNLSVGGTKILSVGGIYSENNQKTYEIGYQNGQLYVFADGVKINSSAVSQTFSRAARSVTLGGCAGTYKFVRVSDGICRHTANFTPATPALDNYTKILFKFA